MTTANINIMVVIYLNWFTPAIASAILETSAQFSIVPNTLSQGKKKKKCSEEKQILLMIFKKGKEQQKIALK